MGGIERSGVLASVICEGQQAGDLAPDADPDRLARFLLDAWQGAVVRMKYTDSREPLDDFFALALPLATGSR
jgi:TetR/AcrR family transcriptional repressor of nem operon